MRYHRIVVMIAAIAALAGCQGGGPFVTDERGLPTVADGITVETLAGRLGLEVVEVTSTHVMLRNAANTVLIFTPPTSRTFVNGREVAAIGARSRAGGPLRVPGDLEGVLRSALAPIAKPRAKTPLHGHIVVDAGHGGRDPGAIAVTGLHEKTVNLDVALQVASLLEGEGLRVTLSRAGDRFVSLDRRSDLANRANADLFVSIHADASDNPRARGFTAYLHRSASADARAAAKHIERAMAGTEMASRGIRDADFHVLRETESPAVLVELGYLSNREDAQLLGDPAVRQRLAQAIADGVCSWLRSR